MLWRSSQLLSPWIWLRCFIRTYWKVPFHQSILAVAGASHKYHKDSVYRTSDFYTYIMHILSDAVMDMALQVQ